MFAFAWRWEAAAQGERSNLSERLAASLCAGIGGHAGSRQVEGLHFAFRPLRSTAASSRAWRPAVLSSGQVAVFHGYFDNAADIASELGVSTTDLAALYALAVHQWGEAADLKIIGEYCALIADPQNAGVRLARSPLRAPPLCYFHDDRLAAAASVPRALFAAGVDRQLNEGRLTDSALLNFIDQEESWFRGIFRVPLGCVVELERGKPRALRTYYDVAALPNVRMRSDADYIRRASELLDDGVRACMSGFSTPGATLSGGLDTPQIAVRALKLLPPGQQLPTFTFHPEEGFDRRTERGMLADERPMVEAFAAMHPRIEPHFTANEGYEHDFRWNEFFHLMGGAPSGLCNMYVFHGLFKAAAERRCDLLLLAEWGNYTFSNKGDWGFVEYLLKGRWRQLWLALKHAPHDDRSIFVKLFVRSLSAFLPNPLWRLAKKIARPGHRAPIDLIQPLSQEYRISSGAQCRLDDTRHISDRYQPWNRRQAHALLFRNGDAEASEIYQAFEQMYGLAQRDPTSYRPFVEFCIGLPVHLFLRDGTPRWLAKQLANGIMPEEQRTNFLNGRWDADWYQRISRRRVDWIAELDGLATDKEIASKLDLPRLRAAIEDWPDETEFDSDRVYAAEMAVPRGLLTARFIKYIQTRNDASTLR